jgi:hypothetical protein
VRALFHALRMVCIARDSMRNEIVITLERTL